MKINTQFYGVGKVMVIGAQFNVWLFLTHLRSAINVLVVISLSKGNVETIHHYLSTLPFGFYSSTLYNVHGPLML